MSEGDLTGPDLAAIPANGRDGIRFARQEKIQ